MNIMNAIEISKLSVRYDNDVVLEDINLDIAEKEIVSIVGPNGSGKSTLLKTIMGLKDFFAGRVSVFGMHPAHARHKGIFGYLPQGSHYDAHFPVRAYDVVAMSRYARHKVFEALSRQDRAAIDAALERVGMAALRHHHFGSLSGGQKQRVLIARALALNPKILILDEPATGLDAVAQDSFYELLQDLRAHSGLTILMVSHDIGAVSEIVDRLACINRKIHFHGKPSECEPGEMIAKVFGHSIHVVRHDKNCPTCRGE